MNVKWNENVYLVDGEEFGRILLRQNRWHVQKKHGDYTLTVDWRETAHEAKLALEREVLRMFP